MAGQNGPDPAFNTGMPPDSPRLRVEDIRSSYEFGLLSRAIHHEPQSVPSQHASWLITKTLVSAWYETWDQLSSPYDNLSQYERRPAHGSWDCQDKTDTLWSLIDLPRVNNIPALFDNVEVKILEIIRLMKPPRQPLEPGEFRILVVQAGRDPEPIRAQLQARKVGEKEDYWAKNYFNALSYCWGLPSQPQRIIFVDGRPFIIGVSLLAAIRTLRRWKEPFPIWIDAICIRQDDLVEKSCQLPLMGQIYSEAFQVILWIGTDDDETVYHVLKCIDDRNIELQCELGFIEGLSSLLQREWFTRTWIIQELALAKFPYLYSSYYNLSWEKFMQTISTFLSGDMNRKIQDRLALKLQGMSSQAEKVNHHMHSIKLADSITKLFGDIRKSSANKLDLARQNMRGSGSASLLSLLLVGRGFNATNMRDKVYSMLGMVQAQKDQTLDELAAPNYLKSVGQVYFDATVNILLGSDVRSVGAYYSFPIWDSASRVSSTNFFVPSWTLNFSYPGVPFAEFSLLSWRFYRHGQSSEEVNHESNPKRSFVIDKITGEMKALASMVDEIVSILRFPNAALPSWSMIADVKRIESNIPDERLALEELQLRSDELSKSIKHTSISQWKSAFIQHLESAEKFYRQHGSRCCSWRLEDSESLHEILLAGLYDESWSEKFKLPEFQNKFDLLVGRASIPDEQQLSDSSRNLTQSSATRIFEYSEPLSSKISQLMGSDSAQNACDIFATKRGLIGMCMPGAQVGDSVHVLFRRSGMDTPFVMRKDTQGDFYRMVCVASLPSSWKELCRHQGTFDPEYILVK